MSNRWVVAAAALLLCLAGSAVFAYAMNRVFPIQDWLVWTLAKIWGWVFLFSLCTFCLGQFVLVRILKLDQLPVLESAVFSAAIGTVGFTLAMYVAGALALYNRIFAVALPPVFLVIGGRDGFRLAVRLWRHLGSSRRGLLPAVVAGFGILCVGLIYLGLLSPDAVNYDATWYHLRIAQDYARWGRIRPFFDYNAIVPHLASILHTWGYLVPGLDGAPRWMMALHMEFALFLWTLVGVAAGIQRLTDDFTLRASWVSFFLFPIIFVYDSNIGGSADHVLAFFAVPVVLATLQLQNGFSKGRCALLAIAFAGASLTKYQAIYFAVAIVPIVVVLWLRDWIRSAASAPSGSVGVSRRDLLWAPAILLGLSVVLVSPHFIKNYLFYRNPVYPLLSQIFTNSTPTVPNASVLIDNIFVDAAWVPKGSFFVRLWHAAEVFITFSFKPHYSFSKDVPAFGSLFTLLLPCLLLVPARRATALAAAIATGALLAWGMTYNVDRNLQTFMPVMVCVTGALLVKLWRLGWLARLGLVPLIALQLVWGADAPFYGIQHQLYGAMDLIRSSYEGRAKSRFEGYRSNFVSLGKALPRDAKVLLHGSHVSLGIDRDTLQDVMGFQGLISYHKVRTPREMFDYLRSLGITHMTRTQVVWDSSRQEQILYDLFLSRYGVSRGNFGGNPLSAIPTQPPPVEQPYRVLCLGLYGYANGLYPIEAMNVNEHLDTKFRKYPAPERQWEGSNAAELVGAADAVLVRNLGSYGEVSSMVASAFESIPTHGDEQVYARRR
jgi:hypothetical protein